MKKLRYFIYDTLNNINTDSIEVEEFEYNNKTKVWNFYYELAKKYVEINYNGFTEIDQVIETIPFEIIGAITTSIDYDHGDMLLTKYCHGMLNRVLCIIPIFCIGGLIAQYNNYRLIIHTNEDNHKHFPHIHVDSIGDCSVINLVTLEQVEGIPITGKAKKKIFGYLKDNQEFLMQRYDDIVNKKIVDKIEKHIIV